MNYWLMKSEPTTYGIADLKKTGTTQWEGVRNYQARNFMRDDMKIGDKVLFYHSNCTPPGIVGLAEVCKESYPDFFAQDEKSKYFDPKANPEKPIWFMVDVKFITQFKETISLETLKKHIELADMKVVQKGSRLSVTPVTKDEYNFIVNQLAKQ